MEEKVKILVTGANGFIGKNLIVRLAASGKFEILPYDISDSEELLEKHSKECAFVFHLAGVNRPQNPAEFHEGNFGFTTKLLEKLAKANNCAPILMSSSIQAELDNDYGKSKKAGEDYIRDYAKANNIKIYIFRLPNVFGKWCRPNYNSVIATFCHNIANGLPIQINNRETELTLIYIDDVVNAFISALDGNVSYLNGFARVTAEYKVKLGYIVDLIYNFVDSRKNYFCPVQPPGSFEKKLYSTYLSYLPANAFKYDLKMNIDPRGSFTEFLKTQEFGQVSVNISKPNITKGNHWHDSKNEKFLVVSGKGVIRFRRVDKSEIIEYCVSGDKLEVVDIPCGYVHSIENIGENDLITIMWANEIFNKDNSDTIYSSVN